MKGSRELGANGWSVDVHTEGVLYDMMAVVSDYSGCWFLGDCCFMSAVFRGLHWKGDMGSLKKSENTDIFSNDKKA